jgi:hypothetical protein
MYIKSGYYKIAVSANYVSMNFHVKLKNLFGNISVQTKTSTTSNHVIKRSCQHVPEENGQATRP